MTFKVIQIHIGSVPAPLMLTIKCEQCGYTLQVPAEIGYTFQCYCRKSSDEKTTCISDKSIIWQITSLIPFVVGEIQE